jgi:uncharacterized membrane protein
VDPATAKTLVSAALVTGIAVFSLVSLQAMLAQIGEDLRAARRVPVRVPVKTLPHKPEA